MSNEVKELFSDKDILVIGETHFNIRCKCPEKFELIARSKAVESKRDRGGVAIYKRLDSNLDITILHDFPDCLVCEVKFTDIVIIAMYIPPSNSTYFNDDCFENMKMLLDYYITFKTVYLLGDLNTRFGDLNINGNNYIDNPDMTINSHGDKLRTFLEQNPAATLLNGFVHPTKIFESKFTFFRGKQASQNDVCITNNLVETQCLSILNKLPSSDHCPVVLKFTADISNSYDLLFQCAAGFRSYDHEDVNLRLRRSAKLEHCNLVNLVTDLEALGEKLQTEYHDVRLPEDIEKLNLSITNGIYDALLKNKELHR